MVCFVILVGGIIQMKCKECGSLLLNIYFRENNEESRNWVRIDGWFYCKKCKNLELG